VRSVTTDVLLEVDDLNGIELPAIKTLPCRIFSLDLKSSNVLILKLRLPHAVELKYIPGQYINLIGQSGVRRSYSLANSIGEDKLLELHIRAVKGGLMSEYLFNEAKINDLMRLTGPFGTFFLRDITNKDVFFLATGTGIAPVKAILESLMSLGPDQGPKSVTVLWGGRVLEDFYFDIDSIPGKFNFVPVLSRGDVSWHGARGYVQHEFLKMQPNLSQSVVYACGSETMIRCAKKLLTQNGLPDSQFYSDAFVCSCSS
jgi:CDP-4-dehydro-6-deoxyglucose reductase